MRVFKKNFSETIIITYIAVLDPDLQIKGGGEGRGGGHPDPDIRGRSGLQKNFFGPSGLILVYKSGGARVPSPLPPWIRHCIGLKFSEITEIVNMLFQYSEISFY